MKNIIFALWATLLFTQGKTQTATTWNGKSCAVVLTYDDAINDDLDNVVPALDSLKLKGTFYLQASSAVINSRMQEWRTAAKAGHELANHSLVHPCEGGRAGREFVKREADLYNYTVKRMETEVRITNTLLKAIDGQTQRTYAYPCGDTKIGDTAYITGLKNDFIAARGTEAGLQKMEQVDLYNVRCYAINGQDATYLINLVKEAQRTNTVLVFLFHGVGGGHPLNVEKAAHSQLIHYLKQNEKNIWIAPMLQVGKFIKAKQATGKK